MTYSQKPRKHILVVDDEETIRKILHAYLGTKGYLVTTAKSGDNAIQIYERSGDKKNKETCCPVDLILTDLNMSPMDGYELFKRIKAKDSQARICVMSANPYDPKIEEMRKEGLKGVLPKPFIMDGLEKLVKSALK